VSAEQAALAFYRGNPRAFIGGNINRLRVGAALRVPSAGEITAVAKREAERQIRMLTRAVTTEPDANANPAAGSRPTSAPADASDKNALHISASGTQERSKVEQLNEELVAAKQAIRELESRLAQVEQNLADMRRLAALKNVPAPSAAATAPSGGEGHAPRSGFESRSPVSADDAPLWKHAGVIGPASGVLLAALSAALMFYRIRMRKVQSALAAVYTQFNQYADPLTERGHRGKRKGDAVASR
jgi:FimV-like protein